MRPFPGEIVRPAPQPAIVGRGGIGIERYRVIRPDAMRLDLLPPGCHRGRIITRLADEIGLHERHVPARHDQPLRQLGGGHGAALGERGAARLRQALDAGLDRHTARPAEQLEQRRLPQVDAGLHPEPDLAFDQRLEQHWPRQEDLVDEIKIGHALCDEPVDLLDKRLEVAPAIAVAIGKLGAEGAGVGAAARGFHLGAEPFRRPFEPVVMMAVPPQPVVRPAERRVIGEAAGMRPVIRGHAAVRIAPCRVPHRLAATVGDRGDHLLAFAHDGEVGAGLGERRPRGDRAMRSGDHRRSAAASERRWTAPEQIGRRRQHHRDVRRQGGNPLGQRAVVEALQRPVEQQGGVPRLFEHGLGITELQRQMGLAAAEIDGAREGPGRIDQRHPHALALLSSDWTGSRRRCCSSSSQPMRSARPSCQRMVARQPVAAASFAVSETYHS